MLLLHDIVFYLCNIGDYRHLLKGYGTYIQQTQTTYNYVK